MAQKSLNNLEKIAQQRADIKENARFLREQEELIKTTIELGNNQIHQLTAEADELMGTLSRLRGEKIQLAKQVDDKRLELLGLM